MEERSKFITVILFNHTITKQKSNTWATKTNALERFLLKIRAFFSIRCLWRQTFAPKGYLLQHYTDYYIDFR